MPAKWPQTGPHHAQPVRQRSATTSGSPRASLRAAIRGSATSSSSCAQTAASQATVRTPSWSATARAAAAIAAAASPAALHDGVLTVRCEAAVWAQELELVGEVLVGRLNEALGEPAVSELRCRTG